jgi:hypothetical protein
MSFKIFVSYPSKDLQEVDLVGNFLCYAGTELFIAEHSVRPAEALVPKIVAAIKECDLFLLLWNSHSIESSWVQQEIGVAAGAGKPILPLVLEQSLDLPAFLAGIKYIRVHDDPEHALSLLKATVFERVKKKQQADGLFWLGLGALVVYVLAAKE